MGIDQQSADDVCISSKMDSNSGGRGGEYEVFLSFHGEDTRKVFTDVLHTFLESASVRTFRDNEDLHVGESIGPELLRAIKQSKISIPVFSKNYASSKWCLFELVQMVQMTKCEECKTGNGRNWVAKCDNCNKRNWGHKIIPIFYDVTPDDVKLKTDIYDRFFPQHMNNFDSETVQQWKSALMDVGGLKGLELKKETDGYYGKLAKKVVEKVLKKLKKSKVQLPEILVGMEHHKEKLEGFLSPHSSCIRILGIHGMGGIGKTTIAKVIYNELCNSYEFCCFLENVGEKSKGPNDLVNLQSQLIYDLARGRFFDIVNVEVGRGYIKDVIKGKKLLLVLDDVDEKSQFDMFFGNSNLVASGSRIIVTTRNKEVLNFFKVTYEEETILEVYEPPLMDYDQSLKLFSNFAFNSDSPPIDFAILSRNIVSSASGLPLALVSISKSLHGNNDKVLWNAKLRERETIPHEIVLEKLRRSFESLNDQQQHIFLDVACLFIGEQRMFPTYMWADCELYPDSNVKENVMRSLIKIKADDSLWMHPQLRDLGRQIVREENINLAGKRSRLWRREEAVDIFDRCMGTDKVLALCLDFTTEEHESRPDCLVRGDFGKLQNLRFLRVGSTDFKGDFERLFSSLRWLQWKPLGNISPTNCALKDLVILDLSESQIVDDWEGWRQIKMSRKLKVLNLSKCDKLSTAPDFSPFESLEILILASCRSLGNIELSNGNLVAVDLSDCSFLNGILDLSNIVKLEYLDVRSCLQLRGLRGFESLVKLRYLNTSGCHNLETVPNLSHLQELKTLCTSECKKLSEIQGLDSLTSLELLIISGCVNITYLPNISNLKNLKEIGLSRCHMINVAEVEGIWELESLELLDVSHCNSHELILDLSNLKKLKKLNLAGFGNFSEIRGLEELKSLESFNISNWKSIQNLPDFSNLKRLKEIKANGCNNLRKIRGLERLESLESVGIAGCDSLQTLPDLPTRNVARSYSDLIGISQPFF